MIAPEIIITKYIYIYKPYYGTGMPPTLHILSVPLRSATHLARPFCSLYLSGHPTPTPPHPPPPQGPKGPLGPFGVIPELFRMESHFEWMVMGLFRGFSECKTILSGWRFRMEGHSERMAISIGGPLQVEQRPLIQVPRGFW